jgi:DNA-binding response OmpR family regulator
MSAAMPDHGSTIEPLYTILVAEDEILLRMPLAEYLRDAGFRVLEAANADEAMAVLGADARVDLAFTDINMSGEEDGFVLVDWVRKHYPNIGVLLTSGSCEALMKIDRFDGLSMVAKPYDFATIERTLRTLLTRSGARGPG